MATNEMLDPALFGGRRRGWRRTIRIKHLLNTEGKSDAECARAVLAVLEADPEIAAIEDGDLIEEMRGAVEEMEDGGTTRWFNAVLNGVYDYADELRIWIG